MSLVSINISNITRTLILHWLMTGIGMFELWRLNWPCFQPDLCNLVIPYTYSNCYPLLNYRSVTLDSELFFCDRSWSPQNPYFNGPLSPPACTARSGMLCLLCQWSCISDFVTHIIDHSRNGRQPSRVTEDGQILEVDLLSNSYHWEGGHVERPDRRMIRDTDRRIAIQRLRCLSTAERDRLSEFNESLFQPLILLPKNFPKNHLSHIVYKQILVDDRSYCLLCNDFWRLHLTFN